MSRPSTAALLFIRRSVINAATRSRTATALLSPLLQQQKQQQQLSDTSCLTTTTASTAIPATRFFSSSNSSNSSSSMGVTKEVIEEGYGPTPTKGQTVTVHCTGYGKNNDLAQKFWCKSFFFLIFCLSTVSFFYVLNSLKTRLSLLFLFYN